MRLPNVQIGRNFMHFYRPIRTENISCRHQIKMFDSNSTFRWPWLTCFWGHLDSMELDKTSTLPKGPVFGPMNTKDCKIYKDNFFLMGFSIFVFLHKCPAHIESTG